jgi:hypothetical protein
MKRYYAILLLTESPNSTLIDSQVQFTIADDNLYSTFMEAEMALSTLPSENYTIITIYKT